MKIFKTNGNVVEPIIDGTEKNFAYIGNDYVIFLGEVPAGNEELSEIDYTQSHEVRLEILSAMTAAKNVETFTNAEKSAYDILKEPTAKQREASLIAKIHAIADDIRKIATDHAGYLKVFSWNAKVERATRIVNGTGTAEDLKIIGAEASIKGISAPEQSQKIIDRATMLGELNAYVDGFEDKMIDAVADGHHALVDGFLAKVAIDLAEQTKDTINAWIVNTAQSFSQALQGDK